MPDHRAFIDALAQRAGQRLPSERLIGVFEAAMTALWRRARVTLGDVTLTAIVNRVLYTAAEHHPIVESLKLASTGLDFRELTRQAGRLDRQPLAEGLSFVMVELLTVIGIVTADILTPALHEALATAVETFVAPEADGTIARNPTHEL